MEWWAGQGASQLPYRRGRGNVSVKKTSNITTDITRDIVWEEVMMMNAGIRPVTQIAVDETWSALRFRPTSDVKSKSRSW
jgi:hypothetical protein